MFHNKEERKQTLTKALCLTLANVGGTKTAECEMTKNQTAQRNILIMHLEKQLKAVETHCSSL